MESLNRPLSGWKAIAAFVGRDARTAKRWEAARGLPVHRMPGGERGAVWADPAELTRWMRREHLAEPATARPGTAAPPPPAPEPPGPSLAPPNTSSLPAPPARWRMKWPAIAGTGAALALAAAAVAAIVPGVPPHALAGSAYSGDQQARALFLRGTFAWSTRTPAGLAAARNDFVTLIKRRPDKPEAYERLADCYLLMREFGSMPDTVAYPAAEKAAARALALAPASAGALRAKAFIDFWWHGDPAALDTFRSALAADPASAQSRHWYANALSSRGRFADARAMIASARERDPDTPAIIADEALIEVQAGDAAAARATLSDLAQLDPRSAAVHRYLGLLALLDRDGATFLRETMAEADARGAADRDLPALTAAWKAGGYQGLVRRLAASALLDQAQGRGSAYAAASYTMLAGDQAGALRLLHRAVERHEPDLVGLPGDALLRPLAGRVALYQIGNGPAPTA